MNRNIDTRAIIARMDKTPPDSRAGRTLTEIVIVLVPLLCVLLFIAADMGRGK